MEDEKQIVKLPLERYVELIKAEQKYAQYKQYLINCSTNKCMEFLMAVERKNWWEITQKNEKENKEEN